MAALDMQWRKVRTLHTSASEFGQILVNSTFTFSLLVGLSVGETTLGTLVANLGFDKIGRAHV